MMEFLHKAIAVDTSNPPGNEKALAEYTRNVLAEYGIAAEVQDLGSNRANLVARVRGTRPGPVLAFNGHLDTVPVHDTWDAPPLECVIANGRATGLGAVDMKGAIAAMISAALEIKSDPAIHMAGELMLVFVADEEKQNTGAKRFLREKPSIDYVVIGEPTNLDLVTSNRGVLRLVITTRGVASHCSNPVSGQNAIYKMARLVTTLEEYAGRIARGDREYSRKPSLAVTLVRGGTAENITPDFCEFALDRRLVAGETMDGVEGEIRAALDVSSKAERFDYEVRRLEELAAWGAPAESRLLRHCVTAYERCFHRKPLAKDLGATSEAGLFAAAGADTVIFGPGDIRFAHARNEGVPIAQLEQAASFYIELAKEILV